MAKNKHTKNKKTPAITAKEQAEYVSPGVDTLEALNAEEISKSLSPAKLAKLVGESKKGNGLALTTLALEMRDEDASFGGNLRTRKLAVLSLPRSLAECSNEKAHELIQQFLNKRYFNKLLYYLLEAIEVGYAVLRLVWGVNENGHWLPVSVHRIDPRRVGFDPNTEAYFWRNFDDPEDRKNIIDGSGDGSGLEYLVYTPDDVLMPNRGGLARLAAFSFMAKRFGLNDWVKFLSSAGMPLRLGKYNKSAEAEERQVLKRALQMLSSDKAAAIPKNTEIELLEASKGQGFSFKNLAEYLDKQIALAVLGQTLTSGEGKSGSYNLGLVHNEVRLDILRADCSSIAAELQDLVDKICLLNFGAASTGHQEVPHISIKPKVQKDLQKLAGVVTTLAQSGLAIPKNWLYEEFGIPEPKDGEEILGAVESQESEKPNAKDKAKDEVNSLSGSSDDSFDAELDAINDAALEYDYRPTTENAVLNALNSSRDFAQFQQKMAKLALNEPDKALAQALAVAATKGALLGRRDGA